MAVRRVGTNSRVVRPQPGERRSVPFVVEPPVVRVHHLEETLAEGRRQRHPLLAKLQQFVRGEHPVVVAVELEEFAVHLEMGVMWRRAV